MYQVPDDVMLQVKNLKKYFPIESGFLVKRVVDNVKAVDGVSFSVKKGQTLGLVGESGCGKTTCARTIIRAYDPTAGSVLFRSRDKIVDMTQLDKKELKVVRQDMQMIFQDPHSSLNPRMPVLDIIAEPLKAHGIPKDEQEDRVIELLNLVGLRSEYARRFPHSFSGGQRQRIGVARALALNPSLILADEAVSALDVSVQAQVLNLLLDLQDQMELTYIFIGHDLSVVRYLCDQVAVMYLGKIVEIADVDLLYEDPKHPYTSTLLGAVPDANPRAVWRRGVVKGEIQSLESNFKGCSFVSRCQHARDECLEKEPELRPLDPKQPDRHQAACHFANEISLEGVGQIVG